MKSFLKKRAQKKWGLKLLALLMALLFWAVVLSSRVIETVEKVPVKFLIPSHFWVRPPLLETVSYYFRGPKLLLRALSEKHFSPIVIDLTDAKPGMFRFLFRKDDISLPLGVEVVRIYPSELEMRLERMSEKTLPIHWSLSLRKKKDTAFLKMRKWIQVMPQWVRVRGPESFLKKLDVLKSDPIDLETLLIQKKVFLRFSTLFSHLDLLPPIPYARLNFPKEAGIFRVHHVPVKIKQFIKKSFFLKSSEKLKIVPAFVTILVKVFNKTAPFLDLKKIVAEISFKHIEQKQFFRKKDGFSKRHGKRGAFFKVHVSLPSGVKLLRVDPLQVAVSIEKKTVR